MDITNQLENFISESSYKTINRIEDTLFRTETSLLTSSAVSLLNSLGVIKLEFRTSDSAANIITILSFLDPENFKKYSYNSFEDGTFSRSSKCETRLQNNIQYLSVLPEHTFMLVRNENFITIYLCGKKSRHLSDLIIDHMTNNTHVHTILDTLMGTTEEKNQYRPITVKTLYYSSEDKELYTNGANMVKVKPLDNIYTNNANKELITTYINKWQKASELFNDLGITYKLGILLYGPPGTGKTTLIKTIASMLNYTLFVVDIASFPESPPDFSDYDNSIILFEDIDYAFSDEFKTVEDKARANALLQALDGVASASNIIFAATTNDINSLSEALVRDGRFDLKISMEELNNKEDAIDMCKSLSLNEEEAKIIVNNMPLPINQANLQNKCIQYIFENVENWSTGEEKALEEENNIKEEKENNNKKTDDKNNKRKQNNNKKKVINRKKHKRKYYISYLL